MDRFPLARRSRRPAARWAAAWLTVAVVAALTPGGAAVAGPAPDDGQLRQAVATSLVVQYGARASAAYGQRASVPVETMVEPKRYAAGRNWVFGGGVIRVPSHVEAAPVAVLFLAKRVGGAWRVALEGTPEFADAAREAPVLSTAERQLFSRLTGNATSSASTDTVTSAATGLALPWQSGQGWAHWGVHGDSGESYPYNSIDFYGED